MWNIINAVSGKWDVYYLSSLYNIGMVMDVLSHEGKLETQMGSSIVKLTNLQLVVQRPDN